MFSLNSSYQLPNQRWEIYPQNKQLALELSQEHNLHPLIGQILINRSIKTITESHAYLHPEQLTLPPPLEEFSPDLDISIELLSLAINQNKKIAICGDYDADGMTSTALLLRALNWLGANVNYAIPSRMKDGYGINNRIVQEFYEENIQIIITVDNGISAHEPIKKARDLGIDVIITDHHDLPPDLPEANAILNPKLLDENSPYYSLAGVGVAYILAVSLAKKLNKISGLTQQLLELFTLGTIADLAPLTGVNRRWLQRGLEILPTSQNPGIKSLIQLSGATANNSDKKGKLESMKPEQIGFRLGPRINAVGRIGDPQIVIDLLTTEDEGLALERAMQCEQINQHRQVLCQTIEKEAILFCQEKNINFTEDKILVIINKTWHHGVIGIVASRLVERYGVPVFIATYEEEHPEKIRGSARGIREFNIFDSLQYCADLLGKFGGHKAAGGFSLPAENWDKLHQKLIQFANQSLKIEHIKPLLEIDVKANFNEINWKLYRQIDYLHPCGIGNADPVFFTPNVSVVSQQLIKNSHLKLTLRHNLDDIPTEINAIAWRWSDYFPLPRYLDIAYKLKENTWNGEKSLQLELVGVRLAKDAPNIATQKAEFSYKERHYVCSLWEKMGELRIKNQEGNVLVIDLKNHTGISGKSRETAQSVDINTTGFTNLINAAFQALNSVNN